MSEFSWWAVITRHLRQADPSIREKEQPRNYNLVKGIYL
jgi:hypothetical protein